MRRIVVIVGLVLLVFTGTTFAQDTPGVKPATEPKFGIAGLFSPQSGWDFRIQKSQSPAASAGIHGNSIEIAAFRDLGERGERGVVVSRRRLNNTTYMGAEYYAFLPVVGNKSVQFGPTLSAGAGIIGGGAMLAGRAQATLAVRTASNVKVSGSFGLDAQRFLSTNLRVSYLF